RAQDGTTYVLDVPRGAVPVETTMTATPVLDFTGLPFSTEHRLGVDFGPAGLRLVEPATLTIRSSTPIPRDGVAALSYRANGHDPTSVVLDSSSGEIRLEVGHFSGWLLTWPMGLPEWRQIARLELENKERLFEHIMATKLGIDAQAQKLGEPTEPLDAFV